MEFKILLVLGGCVLLAIVLDRYVHHGVWLASRYDRARRREVSSLEVTGPYRVANGGITTGPPPRKVTGPFVTAHTAMMDKNDRLAVILGVVGLATIALAVFLIFHY